MGRKVCHISTVHTPFDQRIFHRECWSLARAGFDVHLLVQLDEPEKVVDGVHVHSLGAVRKHTLSMRLGDRLRRLVRAERLARPLDADVYHLHDPELIPLGLWLKCTTSAKVIFDCHENNTAFIQQKHYLHPMMRFVLGAWMAMLESLAARFLDAIITADQGVADLYRTRFKARHVQLVHNFPRLDLLEPKNGNGNGNADAVKEFDLVYHGSIPRYHLEVAFAVAEELRARHIEARWLFFGKCPEADWAQKELGRRGLEDRFFIDPHQIPHEQVAGRVRKARIGFIPLPDLPKFQHNIPTKLFEFMGLGMPTVLSDLPPSRPFVGDGLCAFMVKADDYSGYADAIERLLKDPETAREMGKIGQRRTFETYNWENESAKLIALYQSFNGEEYE